MADPILEEFADIRETPTFSSLSYEEQREVWTNHLMGFLAENPVFMKMNPKDKFNYLNQYAIMPPALENKGSERWMENIASGAFKGDPKSKALMTGVNLSGKLHERSLLIKGLMWPLKTFPKLGRDFSVAFNTWLTGEEWVPPEDLASDPASDEAVNDNVKMSQYYDLLYNEANKGKWATNFWSTVLRNAPAEMVDLIPMYAGLLGSIQAPRGLAQVLTAGANKIISLDSAVKWSNSGAKNAWKMFGAKVWRAAGHSAAGGVLGVIREGILDTVNRTYEDPSFREVLENHARHFGVYAAGDFVGFTIGGGLARFMELFTKQTKAGLKTLTGFKGTKLGPTTLLEYKQLLFDELSYRSVPDDALLAWPKELQDHVLAARAAAKRSKNGIKSLTGVERLRVAAMHKGYVLSEVPTPTGPKVLFRNTFEDSIVMKPTTIEGAWNWLGKQMREGMPANDLKSHFGASHHLDIREIVKIDPTEASWIANQNLSGSMMKNVDNSWTVFSSKEQLNFSTYDDAVLYVFRNSIDEDTFRGHLNKLGLKLLRDKEGLTVATKKGENIASGGSIAELIGCNKEWQPKLPAKSMPKLTVVDESLNKVIYDGEGIARGPAQKVLEDLSRFADPLEGSTLRIPIGKGGEISFRALDKQWIVHVPELGMKKSFNSVTMARRYVEGAWKEFDNVSQAALAKEMELTSLGTQWALYGNQPGYVTGSFDDMIGKIREIPYPDGGPELSGLEAGIGVQFGKSLEFAYKPKHYARLLEKGEVGKLRWWLNDKIKPVGEQIEYAYNRGTVPRQLYDDYVDVLQTLNAYDGRVGSWSDLVDNAALSSSGRTIKESLRRKAQRLFNAEPDSQAWNRIVFEDNLSDDVVLMVRKLHEAWGSGPDEGLFQHFGMPFWKFQQSYFTRIKDFVINNRNKLPADGQVDEMLKGIFGPVPPKSVTAYFENARVSEVVNEAFVQDPIAAMKIYLSRGYKAKLINPVMKRLKDNFDTLYKSGEIPENVAKTYGDFVRSISGTPASVSEAQLRDMTNTIIKIATDGKLTTKVQRNIVDKVTGRVHGAALGFRPWAIIRNTAQPWAELSWRVGPKWVAKALDYLDGNWDEAVKQAKAAGFVKQRAPVFAYERALPKPGKITTRALGGYMNADIENRLVSLYAGKFKFDDAVKRFQAGAINERQFFLQSGLEQMPMPLVDRIRPMLKAGNHRGAGWLIENGWSNETQFIYRQGFASTPMRSGTLGMLYGQLGHYNLFRIQNWRNGIGRASGIHRKMMFAGRAAATAGALYGAYRTITGIDAQNFLPWMSTDLSGGPYFDLVVTLIRAADTNPQNYEARESRAKLGIKIKDGRPYFDPKPILGGAKWLIPGSFQMKSIMKGIEAANEGDYHRMMLNFMGAPAVPED